MKFLCEIKPKGGIGLDFIEYKESSDIMTYVTASRVKHSNDITN